LEFVGDTTEHPLSEPLALVPLCALYGGVALYLLAHAAFRFRLWRHVSAQRVVVAGLLMALIAPASTVPALAALGILAAVVVGLIALESVRFSDVRQRARHEDEELASASADHPVTD
jgi:hypothetical protein